ncbi:MAG: hypothetical protein HOW97_09510 [Catenulispora sp.]|nr:hypothetical protein [Catenulispora sp.]
MSDEYTGRVIITWPQPQAGLTHGATVKLTDADSGEDIVSALDLTVTVTLDAAIVAEMTMLTDADGHPAGVSPVRDEDGETLRTARFRWLVAEMRTVA